MSNWIDEFRAPLECLTGLPNVAFNSVDFAEFERDHILTKTWFCVANEAHLPHDSWVIRPTRYTAGSNAIRRYCYLEANSATGQTIIV